MNRTIQPAALNYRRQHGMVLITLCSIMLVAVSLLIVNSGKTSIMEQMISYNEFRSSEAQHAAEAGLEFGMAYYSENIPQWIQGTPPELCAAGFDEYYVVNAPALTAQHNDDYTLKVYLCRRQADRKVVQVISNAQSAADSTVQYTVSVYTEPYSDILSSGFSGAPLIVDGCTRFVTGTPDIWPDNAPGSERVAYETSQSKADAVAMSGAGPTTQCIRDDNFAGMALNGGIVKHSAFQAGSTWEYVFKVPRSEIQARADAEIAASVPTANRYYFYFNTPMATYNVSVGGPDHPVVLVFTKETDCPIINGNVVIYGIVFVDSACSKASGWGDFTIYGSVVINGGADHFTANTQFIDWRYFDSLNVWRDQNHITWRPRYPNDTVASLLGTWKDF